MMGSLEESTELFFLQSKTFEEEKVILATQQDYFCVACFTSSLEGCRLFSVMIMVAVFLSARERVVKAHCCSTPCFPPRLGFLVLVFTLCTLGEKMHCWGKKKHFLFVNDAVINCATHRPKISCLGCINCERCCSLLVCQAVNLLESMLKVIKFPGLQLFLNINVALGTYTMFCCLYMSCLGTLCSKLNMCCTPFLC